ncbi:MAG: hypothetical protein SGI92_29000 [Bryobacteraceae bacterium]|nr:hypothetical protein [Bryobacteraceae bacterium]
MPCLATILVLLFPRLAVLVLYFFTSFFNGVYDTVIVPFLGLLFMPVTLLAYTWLTKNGRPMDAFYLIVMLVAVLIDLGFFEGGRRSRRSS